MTGVTKMGFHQMLPPASPAYGPNPCIVPGGRKYSAVVGGAPIVVPDFDGIALQANGWLIATAGGAGTTAQRPVNTVNTPVLPGMSFLDTTLGVTIIWDGLTWRNKVTGAAV